MKPINLTRSEKKALWWIEKHPGDALPNMYPAHIFYLDCRRLECLGLVKCFRIEGGKIEATKLTEYGKAYLLSNPTLHNPINYDRILLIITALIGILGIITGCAKF